MLRTQALLERINDVRQSCGCRPLLLNDTLSLAAMHHSVFMFESKRLSHTGRDGSTCTQRLSHVGYHFLEAAENIAYCDSDPAAVLTLWQNSPPHYQNMINPVFCDIGLALVKNQENPASAYWTALFASPLQADRVPY